VTIDTLPTGGALAPIDQTPLALQRLNTTSAALDRLNDWVNAARNASALVAPLVETAFVPDSFRPRVDPRATDEEKTAARAIAVANATAAVLQGITLGLDPLTSLQQIYIVHGRPGMYAKMMVALVQSHGHEVWTEDLSDTRAVVAGRRRGSQQTERITVTMDQARRAGWTKNDAYGKTPQDMLWARAAARVCDRIASDVIKGLGTVEEIRDEAHAEQEAPAGARTVRPSARRAVATRGEPIEPPLDEPATTPPATATAEQEPPAPPAEQPEPAERPQGITAPMGRKLFALLRNAGIAGRVEGLAKISLIIGRDIDSTKDLTFNEGRKVIDNLEAPVVEEPPLDPADDPDDTWPETAQPPLEGA
jgi:hypothetical protein